MRLKEQVRGLKALAGCASSLPVLNGFKTIREDESFLFKAQNIVTQKQRALEAL